MDWSTRPMLTRSRDGSDRPCAGAGQPARTGRTQPVASAGVDQRVRAREQRARGRPRTRRGSGPGRGASGVPRGQSSAGERAVGLVIDASRTFGNVLTPAVQADDISAAALARRLKLSRVVVVGQFRRGGRFFSRRSVLRHGCGRRVRARVGARGRGFLWRNTDRRAPPLRIIRYEPIKQKFFVSWRTKDE